MPDSVLFDGNDDYINMSTGTAVSNGAHTCAVIFKLASDSADYKTLVGADTADASALLVDNTNPGLLELYTGSDVSESGIVCQVSDGWQIGVITRVDGTPSTPTFHRFVFGGSWSHVPATSGDNPTELPTFDRIIIAASGNLGATFDGNILVVGWWNSVLDQTTIETLDEGLAAWIAADPDELWRLDAASGCDSLTGTSTETSRVGTTVDTGDAPAGWTDAGAAQILNPSSDSVDGNWTNQAGNNTDLFDSINETTASDTDYVRSELGPANSATRIKLASGGDPQSSTGHEINWRIAKDAAGGQTIGMTVKLYQGGGNSVGGGTLIASFTRSNVTNTFTDFAEALSGAEADSITNYADLYLEFWANAT